MICAYCDAPFEPARPGQRFCAKRCRQAAFRVRRDASLAAAGDEPWQFAYADPPYPGMAKRYYDSPEVDHVDLVAQLEGGDFAAWALSTSAKTLQQVLAICPAGVRVLAWVKPIGVCPNQGLRNCWEPVVVRRRRRRIPPTPTRDFLIAQPARGWGDLMGRKPRSFCNWLFACLDMRPGDVLVDWFPGTNAVTRAWRELSTTSPAPGRAASRPGGSDAPQAALGDASPEYFNDARGVTD